MEILEQLLRENPHLRDVDYQMLVQRAKQDPAAHWRELVAASIPLVHTVADRLATGHRESAAVAEVATAQVFERLRADDYALVRGYVGYGRWPSLLVRLTQQVPVLAQRRAEREFPPIDQALPVDDPDAPIPALEARFAEQIAHEGERLTTALSRFLLTLHRSDRLLLAMRYEQGLTLRELDHLFRLGSPPRIAALLARVRDTIQPLRAVIQAWAVPPEQHEAVARATLHHLYHSRSLATPHEQPVAHALQHR